MGPDWIPVLAVLAAALLYYVHVYRRFVAAGGKFQYHLATLLCFVIITSLLIGLNITRFAAGYGWPFVWKSPRVYTDPMGLAVDILVGIFLLRLFTGACEKIWRLRAEDRGVGELFKFDVDGNDKRFWFKLLKLVMTIILLCICTMRAVDDLSTHFAPELKR